MSRSDTTVLRPPHHDRPTRSRSHGAADTPAPEPPFTYGRLFWLAYISNALELSAVGLLFRYADFVTFLGGTEYHLGWIVGVGMVGSFTMRMALGSWIDRYGTRPLWIGSLLLFVATCLAHLAVHSHTGAAVYMLRIAYCCAIAGVNGASMTFMSMQGPQRRLAELVGMLGTAGFLGNVLGTALGDLLIGSATPDDAYITKMFILAALLGLVAIPFAWAATRSEKRERQNRPPQNSPSLPTLLRRHNPGIVLAIGVAMGMGLGLPTTFLRTYAAGLNITRIGLFFTVYAVAAIIARVLTRRWAERFSLRRIILLGMAGMVASILLFLMVRVEWQLIVPAIGFGCSHAVLFPSVVAAGSVTFPLQHRGLATVLVLAMWDLGLLIGSPLAGAVIKYSPLAGLPPYPTMFITMSAILAVIGVWYAVGSRDRQVAVSN